MALSRRAALLAPLGLIASNARAGPGSVRLAQLPARQVRNGWGVCANVGQDASVEAYGEMLEQLRTRDLRTVLFAFGLSAAPRLQALRQFMRAKGLSEPTPRVTALITAFMHDPKTTWAMQQRALLSFAGTGMLRAIEGPNEINGRFAGVGSHGPDDLVDRATPGDFAANHLAWSQALGRFKRENIGRLGGIATVAPSLVISPPATIARLADVSALVDAGNMHFYAGHGLQPSLSLPPNPQVGSFRNVMEWTRTAQMRGGPVWLTECGASTSNTYARSGISQAKYLANQLFDYFADGGQRMFIYQAIDGSGKPGETEGNYGLFRRDRTAKPAVAMLAGLQEILSLDSFDDRRNPSDTAPIPVNVNPEELVVRGVGRGGPADPSGLVMPKSDGTTLIAVWNEPAIDDGKGRDVVPPERTITVEFGSVQSFAVHDLMDPDLEPGLRARRARPSTGQGTELALRGYPVLIELLSPGRS